MHSKSRHVDCASDSSIRASSVVRPSVGTTSEKYGRLGHPATRHRAAPCPIDAPSSPAARTASATVAANRSGASASAIRVAGRGDLRGERGIAQHADAVRGERRGAVRDEDVDAGREERPMAVDDARGRDDHPAVVIGLECLDGAAAAGAEGHDARARLRVGVAYALDEAEHRDAGVARPALEQVRRAFLAIRKRASGTSRSTRGQISARNHSTASRLGG